MQEEKEPYNLLQEEIDRGFDYIEQLKNELLDIVKIVKPKDRDLHKKIKNYYNPLHEVRRINKSRKEYTCSNCKVLLPVGVHYFAKPLKGYNYQTKRKVMRVAKFCTTCTENAANEAIAELQDLIAEFKGKQQT